MKIRTRAVTVAVDLIGAASSSSEIADAPRHSSTRRTYDARQGSPVSTPKDINLDIYSVRS